MPFVPGEYVRVKKNNRAAYIEDADYDYLTICYVDKKGNSLDEYDEFKEEDLIEIGYYDLDKETVTKIIQFEIDPYTLVPKGNFVENFDIKEKIDDVPNILLKALRKLKKGIKSSEYKTWFRFINYIFDNQIKTGEKTKWKNSEYDVLIFVYYMLDDIETDYLFSSECIDIPGKAFDVIYDALKFYLADKDKPLKERRLTYEYMDHCVRSYDSDSIDVASKEEQDLFKECVERLCAKDDIVALRQKGYCTYCNSVVFPENWKECRDIFEKLYSLTGDPQYANTLGYIYYYGRANNKVPEYEKAFRCFSIGAAARLYESTYKLADCFKNGYGVVKNNDIAYELYNSVAEDSMKRFRDDEYQCQFADAALRMGSCFENGLCVDKDEYQAYYWYLLARKAIELRMEESNRYGDAKVLKGIEESIDRIKLSYKDVKNIIKEKYTLPLYGQILFASNIRAKAEYSCDKNGVYTLEVSSTFLPDNCFEPILLSIPEFDYCGFNETITYKTSKGSLLKTKGKKSYSFDDVYYDENAKEIVFLLESKESARLKTNYLELKNKF